MTELAAGRPGPRKPRELRDVDEFLDQVRLRPGMWVRRSSLQHLDSMLVGYAVASEIHGSDESFDFWNSGPFSQWLWKRMNMTYPSNLGWAVEIERAAEAAGTPPMEMFFSLLDEFRAERGRTRSAQEG
ncbi:hypothetical protein GCM10010260_30730 [Streptomyces filipinensis]|uniref:Uncharacterized protein n=1 Tax=Streptomyces filipinensis TaxID=66887 RepID=A0A918IAV9_9ACTN|nr:hypothetical protein [Streptomyces filipinensis]GGU93553.1 hypothetical protein GCM10010260_30730 [Streptomyces filipinensis]